MDSFSTTSSVRRHVSVLPDNASSNAVQGFWASCRVMRAACRWSLLVAAPGLFFGLGAAYGAQETLTYGGFGEVTLYREAPKPTNVVLFISGDGGWKYGVIDMAEALTKLDSLVIGIDILQYKRSVSKSSQTCVSPGLELDELSKYVQKKLDYPDYVPPVLVGYSSGATLVYACLAQAPRSAFRGGLSLGFCPDSPLSKKLCEGTGLHSQPGPEGKGFEFLPQPDLSVPWIALQGTVDPVCSPSVTEDFVGKIKKGELVRLPGVGHGFSIPKNWMPQFTGAFKRLVTQSPPSSMSLRLSKELPLIEVPATRLETDILAIHLTGDGGWGSTDRGVSGMLADRGISVVGLNSLHYFWRARPPEESSKDLELILRSYLSAWGKKRVVLLGYSFGADVLPFLISRLPADLRGQITLVALLSLGGRAEFEFHLTDWLGATSGSARPVAPEIEKLKGMRILCFYGQEDSDELCSKLPQGLVEPMTFPGGHVIGHDYQAIGEDILRRILD